jgi:hypothetical protein
MAPSASKGAWHRISGPVCACFASIPSRFQRCLARMALYLRRCISRRAPQIESFFESRESSKYWGFECSGSALIHADRGCRIRTIFVMF